MSKADAGIRNRLIQSPDFPNVLEMNIVVDKFFIMCL